MRAVYIIVGTTLAVSWLGSCLLFTIIEVTIVLSCCRFLIVYVLIEDTKLCIS